jgi:hypothetical protein
MGRRGDAEMAGATRTIEINLQVFELACRGAALDQIDVVRYLESIVMRDAEYIRTREFLEGSSANGSATLIAA